MLQMIRGLAVAGLVLLALAVWIAFSDIASPLLRFAFTTGTALIFAAGLLTLTLTIPRRQRLWTAALLASLSLTAYWSLVLDGALMPSSLWFPAILNTLIFSILAVAVIFSVLAIAAPALLALSYTIRPARPAPHATQDVEEHGSFDITAEPI